ncbi:MAG TPA: hypothetical protein VFL75_02520 [Candidatus Limnocylindria bacterium]|jgi:hypothetical protein|nr:hypothetical protein [Candidatus Limnocylindria bacterium]
MDDSTQPNLEPVEPAQPVQPAPPPAPSPVDAAAEVAAQPAWTPAVRPALPGSVVGAAVILLVLGVLTGLMAAVFLLSGSIYDQLPDSTFGGISGEQLDRAREISRGVGVGLGVVAGVIALGHLASGAGIFRRASWARVIGLVVAGLGILFTGLMTLVFVAAVAGGLPVTTLNNTGLSPQEMEQAVRIGAIFGLVIFGAALLAYLFTLVALIRNGRAFG